MYKKIIISVFVICSIFVADAQTFKKDDLLIDLGAGFGESWFTQIKAKPMFNISIENGILNMSNFASLGIGVYGSHYNAYYEKDEYLTSVIAVKAVLHFTIFNSRKFDFYAGSLDGIIFNQSHYYIGNILFSDDTIMPYTNILIGSRWMLKDNFGVFAELHSFYPLITGGVTIKL